MRSLGGHEFEEVETLFTIQPGTGNVDTGGREEQEGTRNIRDQLWTLDLGKSGPVIPGPLQGMEVLGDTWIL